MSTGGSDSGSGTDTAVAPPGMPQALRVTASPQLGGVLGRYQLIEVLGHGAMATVFRARDTQLSREVAVKVMTLAVAARADSAERFRREARAVAAVKHPGIVEIFDFVAGTDTDPAYIVSELIRGSTLRKFLDERRGRLLPETAALIAMALAEALQAAHVRGVVHRDIKPDNVMLEREGASARVVLTDFGVAQVTGMETMTATGALVGSPSYMSPEQGRGEDVGPASDLFSLGVLLYEMATGVLPFAGRDPLTVLSAISRGVFKRPSAVNRFAGAGIDEICGRCLRGNPAERYADAAALAADMRAYCAGVGIPDGSAALRGFLNNPDAFEASLRPRIADACVATAKKHARRGELAKALGHLSRATAYVPGHPEAERLIARISSRRAWAKVAAVASGVAVVGFGAWTVAPWVQAKLRGGQTVVAPGDRAGMVTGVAEGLRGQPEDRAAEAGVAESDEAVVRRGSATAPSEAGIGNVVSDKDREVAVAAGTATKARRPKSGSARGTTRDLVDPSKRDDARRLAGGEGPGKAGVGTVVDEGENAASVGGAGAGPGNPALAGNPSTVAGAEPSAVGNATGGNATGAVGATETPASSPPAPATGAPDTTPPANTGASTSPITLLIFAEAAFCTPSVDDRPPRLTPARYSVTPGVHKIHCLMPGGERWTQSLTISPTPAGTPFRVQLRRNSQGRPTIDPTATTKTAPP
ncbi:MAG TPA: protein kinase [Polyangia bacterium]